MSKPLPIIGAGVAGLTTALALAHCGRPSTLYEKASTLDPIGAGIQLSPNAMHVLTALGLAPALKAKAVEPVHIAIGDGRQAKILAKVPLGQSARAAYGAPYWVIHRADLQAILLEACEASPAITIKLGQTLNPEDDHQGPIIAADGVHSAWRSQVRARSAGAQAQFSGQIAWRTLVPIKVFKADHATALWLGPSAHLVDYPISGGSMRNLVAITRATTAETNQSDGASALAEAFQGWHPSLRDQLSAAEDWTPWPLFTVDPQASWVTQNIALVGDAAHAMLPFAAQGGAMAIEDAWVLVQMLTFSAQSDQAFARYQAARTARVQRVWQQARRNGTIYHASGPMALARNAVLARRSGEALRASLDWLYGWRAGQA